MSLRKISMAVAIVCLSALGSYAQNAADPDVFYVRIDNLTVDSYATLHNTLKADGRFEIDVACVPAHILKIKMKGAHNADVVKNLAAFQTLATSAQLSTATLLLDFDTRKFTDACKAIRSGN